MRRPLREFTDPRLVSVYNAVCDYDSDAQPGFYLGLAMELDAERILDIGCGTGLITNNLARLGFTVTGVEPAPLMLARARLSKYADRVDWIEGYLDAAPVQDQDLALMTGHVAQFFLSDEEWAKALTHVHRALRHGGVFAFESRDPAAREWESWAAAPPTVTTLPGDEQLTTWSTVDGYSDQVLSYTLHYRFATGAPHDQVVVEEITATNQLRFRTRTQLEETLGAAGFTIKQVYGTWDREPHDAHSRELIVVASRS